MRIRPFEYHTAVSFKDALEKIGNYGTDARVLAGGTDLVLAMKHKEIRPAHIVSLHKIKELDFIEGKNASIRIGAMSRHADLAANAMLKECLPSLCEAVNLIGSWQIRNVANNAGAESAAGDAVQRFPPMVAIPPIRTRLGGPTLFTSACASCVNPVALASATALGRTYASELARHWRGRIPP